LPPKLQFRIHFQSPALSHTTFEVVGPVKQMMTTNLGHPEGWKNENPKNWEPVAVPDVEHKFIVKKSSVSVQYVQVQKESVQNHVKHNIGTCYKPKVNGTIAGTIE